MINWFNTVRKQTESILESIKSQEFITMVEKFENGEEE